ncbi:NAD(P)-binding protein [Phlegmacium glaucopus]|nr:NAD(P)-binding protein [Phlegmacium glaucopus]
MPTIDKGAKVLVSGANGFFAMWVVRILLERGFSVRGTVRSVDKGKHVIEYFTSLGYGDKIDIVAVEDIAKEGAFDEAIKGMDAVVHTASPCHANEGDPQDVFVPAVQGTLNILKSAVKSQVHRIVITSTIGAIAPSKSPVGTIYTELDFNEDIIRFVEQLGKNSPPMLTYVASKALAEKRAWEFYEEHKSELQWDLTIITPPFLFGPSIQEVTSKDTLSITMKAWAFATDETPKPINGIPLNTTASWVDVRDCALGHVLSLEKSAAGGERIIVSASDNWAWQDWVDAVNTVSPSLSRTLPAEDIVEQQPGVYDTSKQQRILGIKFKSKVETTKDILEDFAKRGW